MKYKRIFRNGTPGAGETGTAPAALHNWGGLVAGGNGGTSSGPKAFVNIIIFDKNYNLLDAAWDAIDPAAHQVGVSPVIPHDYMMREYTAREEGFVFMYVSNESGTLVDVYFDDVVMTHTPGNVIQYNEYYPFGMQTANSWTRENTTPNQFLYNGATEWNATTAVYDLLYRNYDPVLGRMQGVDPKAVKYASLTPYNYSFNDPVTFNDPSGADPWDGGPYNGCMACYYAHNSGYASPGREGIMDPGGGGYMWNPATAGGYGVAGSGVYREFGISMAFGALPYSATGRAYEAQMRRDGQEISHDRFAFKYGYELWVHGKEYKSKNDNGWEFHPEYYYLKPYSNFLSTWNQNAKDNPVPYFNVLYRSMEMDIFSERVIYKNENLTVDIKTIVILDFNSKGNQITNVRGFRIVATTNHKGQSSVWSTLPRNMNNKIILPDGMSEVIQSLENFWRPGTFWDKYWEFITSPQEKSKRNSNYGTSAIR